ncbi:hypothetical protein KY320_01885 [Candidatus Woesearchaeota archaeon]|nr:hypothetical protein [Candidatus Woesearchaeota archaeon]
MSTKKYTAEDLAKAAEYAGRVMAEKQCLDNTLIKIRAGTRWMGDVGEMIGYRAFLRSALTQYEGMVPAEAREVLERKGVINSVEIREMTDDGSLAGQLPKNPPKCFYLSEAEGAENE